MKTLESKGTIRRVIERENEFLVSFPNHDGYFKVPPSAQAGALKEKILTAQKGNQEISFTYDADLNILKIA